MTDAEHERRFREALEAIAQADIHPPDSVSDLEKSAWYKIMAECLRDIAIDALAGSVGR